MRLFAAFALFALGLAVIMGLAGFIAASNLDLELLHRRSALILDNLIAAEMRERKSGISSGTGQELLSALSLNFLVGKQLPPALVKLAPGFHVLDGGRSFVLTRHIDGIPYALAGPINSKEIILDNAGTLFLICGLIGLAAAVILGLLIARYLSAPIRALSGYLAAPNAGRFRKFPDAVLKRRDELGVLGRSLKHYQKTASNHLEAEKFFTGAASHELRTPLTIISQGLELLEVQTPRNEKSAAILKRLTRTADNMRRTLSSLLELARGDRQPGEIINTEAVLLRVIGDFTGTGFQSENAAGQCRPARFSLADGNSVVLDGKGTETWAQEELAATIFRNLLENALRNANGEDVELILSRDEVRIANRARFSPAAARNPGFGLMIVQMACERLGWRLVRAGKEGETIFKICFSLASDET